MIDSRANPEDYPFKSDEPVRPHPLGARPAVIVRKEGLNALMEIDDHVTWMGGLNDGWCYGHDTDTCELDDEQWDRVYVAEAYAGTEAGWVAAHIDRFPDRTPEQFR